MDYESIERSAARRANIRRGITYVFLTLWAVLDRKSTRLNSSHAT